MAMRDHLRAKAKRAGRLARRLARLRRDSRGSSIVEFAIVAAPFIALLIAIIETSLVFFAQQSLETTAEYAARSLMTGQAQQASQTAQQFHNDACKSLPPYMNCNNLMVDVTTVSNFSDAFLDAPSLYDENGNRKPDNWSFQPGGAGSIVVMRLMYIWPVPMGPLGFNLATLPDGQRLLMATSVLKTEPYK